MPPRDLPEPGIELASPALAGGFFNTESPGKSFLLSKIGLIIVLTSSGSLSCARLLATPWTAAYQAPQSMEFSRQEYWSGLPYSPV